MRKAVFLVCLLLGSNIQAATPKQVVIFPFERTDPETAEAWLGYGLELVLEDALPSVPIQERLAAIDEMDLPEGQGMTLATKLKIAEQLHVPDMITGHFSVSESIVHVGLEVFHLEDRTRSVTSFEVLLEELPGSMRVPLKDELNAAYPYPDNFARLDFERYVRGTLQAVLLARYEELERLAVDPVVGKFSRERLADLYYVSENYELALPILRELAVSNPSRLPQAGWCAVEQAAFEEGVSFYLKYLQYEQDPVVVMNAAGCLASAGREEEGLVMLAAIDDGTSIPDLMFNRAVLQAATGDVLSAMEALKQLVETHRMTDDCRELAAYCCCHMDPSQFHDLCALFQDEAEIAPTLQVTSLYRFLPDTGEGTAIVDLTDIKALYLRMARERIADGDPGAAADSLRRVLEMDPVHRDALELMCTACGDESSCRLLEKIRNLALTVAGQPDE